MKSNKTATVIALALSFLPIIATANAYALVPANEMRDLSTNHWAYKAIEALSEKYGVMTGYPDKTFKGSKNITRYEMAAALFKVMTKVEELIAKANKMGVDATNTTTPTTISGVSKEDVETLNLLQKEFRDELAEVKGKVEMLSQKVDKMNKVKIGGQVDFKYRDRLSVTDSVKTTSPLNGVDVDGDKGKTRFNDSLRNLITEFDRTPYRLKTTLDVNATWNAGLRFYGNFVVDDGTSFKLGPFPGQAVGGHFGDEGVAGSLIYTQRAALSIRNNFQGEFFNNTEMDNYDIKPLSTSGTSFYHDNKPGYGVTLGLLNFQNILRTGTRLKNHFNDEKWIGHGYGLVGFGSDDILVKDGEIKNAKGETSVVKNAVSRFWATGINVSKVDPDSERYNNVPALSAAFDWNNGPITFVVGANAGSPFSNRFSALTNNLGAGDLPYVSNVTPGTLPLSSTASPTGIVTGADSETFIINEKVTVGTKDPLSPRTTYNLLTLPSEYGDGYGVLGVDFDLGIARLGINYSDYWLDSMLSVANTRKNISAVLDIGTNAMGFTLQADYFGMGVDTYSAAMFMNDLNGMLDIGVGFKSATRGLLRFDRMAASNIGFYIAMPQKNPTMPKVMLSLRQSFGDSFGSPKTIDGKELPKVALFKDSGITINADIEKFMGTTVGLSAEYNLLNEGGLWSGNVMAQDFGVFTKYRF